MMLLLPRLPHVLVAVPDDADTDADDAVVLSLAQLSLEVVFVLTAFL